MTKLEFKKMNWKNIFLKRIHGKSLKCYIILGTVFVLIAGTLAHFLYDWTDNDIVGMFTPVNESIWEHMKLLFFPMLLYSIFLIFKFKGTYPCIASSLCFGILTGILLIPVFFYTYTFLLGKDIFILDIAIFILCTIIAFRLSYRLTLSCRLQPYTLLLCSLVCALFLCFIIFTYHPPNAGIFQDPAVSQSPQGVGRENT